MISTDSPVLRSKRHKPLCILIIAALLSYSGCKPQQQLETITVSEFSDFIETTGYVTDAEKFGWSIVQKTVFEYEIVNDATWRLPDGKNAPPKDHPVTQVSYQDAMAYCQWAGVALPDYDAFWLAAEADKRPVIMNNTRLMGTTDISIVGNTWDLTTSENTRGEIRLAGGSYLCAPTTCNGTNPERTLYVSKDTGNSHISFSVFR